MSKSYDDNLRETVYLLKSPANAKHLEEAIAEYQAGKTQEHDLIDSGRWVVTIEPISQVNLSHSAFLNSYATEDEGLYDNYPTEEVY